VSIADNLAALRIQLLAGDANPAAVGQLLLTLGEQVRAVSESDIGAPVADRLSRLSELLSDRATLSRAGKESPILPPLFDTEALC
jgi:hypothetical protein